MAVENYVDWLDTQQSTYCHGTKFFFSFYIVVLKIILDPNLLFLATTKHVAF